MIIVINVYDILPFFHLQEQLTIRLHREKKKLN